MPSLSRLDAAGKGSKNFSLPKNGKFTLGRDPGCNIILDVEGVSRLHAVIYVHNNQYTIQDQESTNGIKVNGCRVLCKELKHNDQIKIGNTILVFDNPSKKLVWLYLLVLIAGLSIAYYLWPEYRNNPPPPLITQIEEPALPSADFNDLLSARSEDWLVKTYAKNSRVLVISFPSLKEQAQALNRAVSFIEKEGAPKDRVMGDVELAAFIFLKQKTAETFSSGFDFSNKQIAEFFTQAIKDRTVFNDAEERLLDILIKAKHLEQENKKIISLNEEKAILTFVPSAFSAQISAVILTHELSHGRFFTDSKYQDKCSHFWNHVMNEDERKAFKSFLAHRDYDLADEMMIVINEMQAWLMFTPDEELFNFNLLGLGKENLNRLRQEFQRLVLD